MKKNLTKRIRPQSGRCRQFNLPYGCVSGAAKPSKRSERLAFEGQNNV